MTVTGGPREGAAPTPRTRSNAAAMSLTYSDFLYTRNDYSEVYDGVDGGEREERRRLPSDFRPIQETKVPLMQNEDAVNHDFIIVAEFSELEGPIPLCTIPNDAASKTDIKINDFVVHLMSTDYQVNTVGQFGICQDTQVMRKNVFPNVHVFMQYFTLYDIKARGFVRPFCFGYVTKDHIKLDKYIKFLVSEFGKVTSVLEYCNREWFSNELNLYLQKLQLAKDSYLQDHSGTSGYESDRNERDDNDSQSDEFVDSDAVSLDQIAHQYSEINTILTTVQNYENPNLTYTRHIVFETSSFFRQASESSLATFVKKIQIRIGSLDNHPSNAPFGNPESLNIPLVHPLRSKGEALRPLTVMGQLGSVYLVGKLMQIYNSCKMDIIFTEMTESTLSFREHFRNLRLDPTSVNPTNADGSQNPRGISTSAELDGKSRQNTSETSEDDASRRWRSISETSPFEIIQDNKGINNVGSLLLNSNKNELQQIIEKLHTPAPVISDNKSGSYHTVSEEDSDMNLPSSQTDTVTEVDLGVSVLSSFTEMGSAEGSVTSGKLSNKKVVESPTTSTDDNAVGGSVPTMNSLYSFSSDEEISLSSSPTRSSHDTSEETIIKEPWWIYASQKLVGGVPGYGLAKFFRVYHKIAHHILYSILLGRPIIICGKEKWNRRIGRLITSLIPLIPAIGGPGFKSAQQASKNASSWKLLRWHRGILVQAHIETYRLIGLCIPEKLEVHDLIPPRLVTLVTIIGAEKKTILGGPAYSGDLFQNFEKKMQLNFDNSDVSLLSYIGGIYAEIEGKVYMYKSLVDKYKGSSKTSNTGIYLLFKELNLRASDIEIVKYLGNLISDPSECVNIL